MKMPKILIIGCGLTGAATYHYLCGLYPHLKSSIQIWEAAAAIGGRMSTDRNMNLFSSCDLGAQYITKNSNDYDAMYQTLCDSNILIPLKDNSIIDGMKPEHLLKKHFIAPQGTSSIVGALAQGVNLQLNKKLTALDYDRRSKKILATSIRKILSRSTNNWSGVTEATGALAVSSLTQQQHTTQETEEFDAVVLSILAPQILSLSGNFFDELNAAGVNGEINTIGTDRNVSSNHTAITSNRTAHIDTVKGLEVHPGDSSLSESINIKEALATVRYSSRFALALHYEVSAKERYEILSSVPWRAKYIFDDDVIRYISIENFKYDHDLEEERNSTMSQRVDNQATVESDEKPIATLPLSVLIHTAVPYGIQMLQLRPELRSDKETAVDSTEEQAMYDDLMKKWEQGIVDTIVPKVHHLLPSLSTKLNSRCYLHRWEYSQVSGKPVIPGSDAVQMLKDDLPEAESGIVLAGDALTESNFEGCLRSAKCAAQVVGSMLTK